MMMCTENQRFNKTFDDSDVESDSSGEELPIWVRGEQRWVSGVATDTTCQDVIEVLLRDEQARGKHVGLVEDYHITERWRGVEQPLDLKACILDIWNAWGTAQSEIKISLRRVKDERFLSRKKRWRSDSSNWSDRSAYKTVHPKRLHALQNEKHPTSTEQLLKLVLAQGEVIRKQLKKLRHSEHQIGYLEEKAHKARARKHGSNYLLETYLKGLSEAVNPTLEEEIPCLDKNSDSGVMTEADSEKSQNKQSSNKENERFSPSSDELQKDIKDEDDTSSSCSSETTVKEQTLLLEKITKTNKRLLKEEENLVKLQASLRKLHKTNKENNEELNKQLNSLKTDMTKSACEMQHNEIVMEETMENLMKRKCCLESLHRDLLNEDQEFEMLQALLYSKTHRLPNAYFLQCNQQNNTKEVLDTLV